MNKYKEVDYRAEALDRVTEQFQQAEVFKRYLLTLLDGYDDIQQCLKDVMQLRSIDTAEGKQLDIIGDIVGQSRELPGADLREFFGFEGAINAHSMGELGSTVGGVFYTLGDELGDNVVLTDAQYRMVIKSKIFRNSFRSTPEDLITALNQIFNTTGTEIVEDGGGKAVVVIHKELSSFEKVLLTYVSQGARYNVRLIPKTLGVDLTITST